MRVGLAADHQGFDLKERILASLRGAHWAVVDYGAFSLVPGDDYPDFVVPLARAVADGLVDRGIAICGSGVGACIAANKIKNVRAGIISDLFSARQGVEDDAMNVICIGSRLTDFPLAQELVREFLEANFNGAPRFQRRLEKISKLETEMEIQR